MSYNFVMIISIIICGILSLIISYYGMLFILDETSSLFKVGQLIIAVVCMTSFYAPIKFFLIEYMNVDLDESEKDHD